MSTSAIATVTTTREQDRAMMRVNWREGEVWGVQLAQRTIAEMAEAEPDESVEKAVLLRVMARLAAVEETTLKRFEEAERAYFHH